MKRSRRHAGPEVVISCEHAANRIPRPYRSLFDSPAARVALDSHRGWDPGSLELGRTLAHELSAPLIICPFSRLLIEPNRSDDSPQLYSEWTRILPAEERAALQTSLYTPHRERVAGEVQAALAAARAVVHVSVHTFTPVWKGTRRPTDVGLLYDHRQTREVAVVRAWRRRLQRATPDLTVHLNRPYRGWTDGLTTAFRRRFPAGDYVGLELEVNQRFPAGDLASWRALQRLIAQSLLRALTDDREP